MGNEREGERARGPELRERTAPSFWPRDEEWPVIRNGNVVTVVLELESYPPIYVMSDGTRVRGVLTSELRKKLIEDREPRKKPKPKSKTKPKPKPKPKPKTKSKSKSK